MGNDFRTINTRLIVNDQTKAGLESAMGGFKDFARSTAKELGSTILGGLDLTQGPGKLFEGATKGLLDIGKTNPTTAPFAMAGELLVGTWLKTADAIEQANQKLKEHAALVIKLRDLGTTPTGIKQFEALGDSGKQWLASMQEALHNAFGGDQDARKLFTDAGVDINQLRGMTAEGRIKTIIDSLTKQGGDPTKQLVTAQGIFGADAWELLARKNTLMKDFLKPPKIEDDFQARQMNHEREMAQMRARSEANAAEQAGDNRRLADARTFTEELERQAQSMNMNSFEVERAALKQRSLKEGWEKSAEGAAMYQRALKAIGEREINANNQKRLDELKAAFPASGPEQFLNDLNKFEGAFNAGQINKEQFGQFLLRNRDQFKPAEAPTNTGALQAGSAEAARFILGHLGGDQKNNDAERLDLEKEANKQREQIKLKAEEMVDQLKANRVQKAEMR